jgi:acetylornithine deacetylase/succinyl-diaminopimelate desuccinylase-like protein
MVPDEDRDAFLEQVRKIVNDPAIEVRFSGNAATQRPVPPVARLDSEIFRTIEASVTGVYNIPTLPSMATGATDMAQLRARGMECVGIGAAIDVEDQAKGFGMHSDQERLLESELHRFVRFNWEIVTALARTR